MVRARWNVCLVSKTSCMFCWEKLRKKNLIFISFFPMRCKCKDPAGVRQRPALPRMRIQVGDQVSAQFSWQTQHPTSWYQSWRSVGTSQWIVASFSFKYWQLFKMHNSSCACVILFLVCVINWFTLNWPVTQLNEAALSKVKHMAIIQTDSMWWNERCVQLWNKQSQQNKGTKYINQWFSFISSRLKIDLRATST